MTGQQSVLSKSCDDLIVDPNCQARDRMNGETIEEYAELYRTQEDLPPIDVFDVDGGLIIVDGFHRLEAAKRAGVLTLAARVVGKGSMADAKWYALASNQKHGLRRTRDDKRRAVRLALELDPDRSNREIARHVGVSDPFVAKLRRGEQLRIPAVFADPEEMRQEAEDDFRSGNFERARVFYEKAIVASRTQSPYTPLRIALAEGPRLCAEQVAPAKRASRIGSSRSSCTLCGLAGSVSMQLYWTSVHICTACLHAMHEKAGAAHEPAQQIDHAEAAE